VRGGLLQVTYDVGGHGVLPVGRVPYSAKSCHASARVDDLAGKRAAWALSTRVS
jgi:hypothetical protein